jgi:hypothetical protein
MTDAMTATARDRETTEKIATAGLHLQDHSGIVNAIYHSLAQARAEEREQDADSVRRHADPYRVPEPNAIMHLAHSLVVTVLEEAANDIAPAIRVGGTP